MKTVVGLACFVGLTIGTPALAQDDTRPRAEPLDRVVACRSIASAEERLRCYDREVASFDDAERRKDIVVVDRAGVKAARRSLFGLRLPSLKLFGDDENSEDAAEFTNIETTVKRAERSGNGWLLTLEDDARWVQTDSTQLASEPRAGTRVRIRQGALGSFLANIGNAPAIRMRRIN